MNAANEKVNAVVNVLTGEEDAVPATARYYKSKGLPWVVVGECRGADGILEGGGVHEGRV